MKQKKVAVIGGGASGLMAAICAARKGGKVTVFESNDRVGKKILATGNGKCNFSNNHFSVTEHYYTDNVSFLEKAFQTFSVADTTKFFSDLGMMIYERDGYLYPASEQASTVLDLLRLETVRNHIQVENNQKVQKIVPTGYHTFCVITDQQEENFDAVILACGSKAAPKTGSDGNGYLLAQKLGHSIKKTVPALAALKTAENLKAISGVRAKVALTLYVDGQKRAYEEGELQLTDYGISGIVVFQISRIAAYALREKKKVSVKIDFLPKLTSEEYRSFMEKRMNTLSHRNAEDFFLGILNKKLIQFFLKSATLQPETPIAGCDKKKLEKVISTCKNLTLTVSDTNTFDQAQVCAGGVVLSEITEEMESRLHPGLFFAGEILDVDGKCGGYNLQWAWTSGAIAGISSVKEK